STGGTNGDAVNDHVTALANGNYVVVSPSWGGGRGAVTWGSGSAGVSGTIAAANSLVGTSGGDAVGGGGITLLTNGNYVVVSPGWGGGTGAVTWGSATAGVSGTLNANNSLVGLGTGDAVGGGGVTALTSGNFIVASPHWGAGTGAVTWASG